MSYTVVENNQVAIAGNVLGEIVFSNAIMGESFYQFHLSVPRYSGEFDIIPCLVSERLVDVSNLEGKIVCVNGQYRSHNKYDATLGKSRLVLSVFVQELEVLEELNTNADNNRISIMGHICKPPMYRTTPLGKEICDGFVAINRPYKKSDYIPLIAWGRNAKFFSTLSLGERVYIKGRIQSRQYQKRDKEGNSMTLSAYEVSIASVSVIEEEE